MVPTQLYQENGSRYTTVERAVLRSAPYERRVLWKRLGYLRGAGREPSVIRLVAPKKGQGYVREREGCWALSPRVISWCGKCLTNETRDRSQHFGDSRKNSVHPTIYIHT